MGTTGLIISAVAIGSAYFFYQYGKKSLPTEEVEELVVGDIAAYFKSKSLRKGVDVPFVATKAFFAKERTLAKMIPEAPAGSEVVVLGVMNKETDKTTLDKVIITKKIDDSLSQSLKDKGLVVLG